LESVRLLASRPAALLDPFALLAALEQLSDHAREANHPQCKKFDAIFKQWCPLANSSSLDVSGHNTTGREPFLDAVLTAEELVF